MTTKYHVGDLIYFAEEKRPYKIRACNDRFLICTKSYPKPKTVLYTIVDLVEGIRGTDNYSLGWCDYYKTNDCQRMLKELQKTADSATTEIIDGKIVHTEPFMGTYISRRNRIELNIINHKTMEKKTYEELENEVAALKRSCASYKGENTKLREKLDVICAKNAELHLVIKEAKVERDRYIKAYVELVDKVEANNNRSWWERFKELFG